MRKRHWFKGETLRYSSGYSEDPAAYTATGKPAYPASPADKADVMDAMISGRSRFETVSGRAIIREKRREQGTLLVFYRDAYYIVRVVEFRAIDNRR